MANEQCVRWFPGVWKLRPTRAQATLAPDDRCYICHADGFTQFCVMQQGQAAKLALGSNTHNGFSAHRDDDAVLVCFEVEPAVPGLVRPGTFSWWRRGDSTFRGFRCGLDYAFIRNAQLSKRGGCGACYPDDCIEPDPSARPGPGWPSASL